MNFNRVNNIAGWAVCLVACTVYIMTMEANASLWDCGEFISSAYKLQIPHPPGAPLFVILGRLFTAFWPGDDSPSRAVNLLSALCSGFTILFLFWTITHFARKIVMQGTEALSNSQTISIIGAGVVGALAYTFSDSFWYSAVEGEVYAMSSFFTALVFWAILKWEHNYGKPGADRWVIFIFFMMGLSIGVHLLNLLTIPAIVMVYFFRKYEFSLKGALAAFGISILITGLVQKAVIQYTVKAAGALDVLFVNDFGLPFFSGFTFFFILIAALVGLGIWFAIKKGWYYMRLGLWCVAFMLLGYSTYFTTMIRSSANPSVDMYNVDNPMSLEGYLGREQYGDWPLLKGPVFTARPTKVEAKKTYQKSKGKYTEVQSGYKYEYSEDDQMFFPRIWEGNDENHVDFYVSWLGLNRYQNQQTGRTEYETPTFGDNVNWFWTYQLDWMYFRYFMWNFSGKQNDVQGTGNVRDANWITGIGPFDNIRLGDQSKLPDSVKNNKAHNKLFALPFILGLLGFFFQLRKQNKDFLVTGLLFFFTGFAIMLYLNQAGPQPRERDYAYVGSFYAFAIWIGLGVLQVREWFTKLKLGNSAGIAATALCLLAVPVLMASQEWDDHDRSQKVLARDLAKDYLQSCAPNAILVTFGDNDTYPLWYAQEVEGIRKDVRVINTSLLSIDWYINQLRYKVNESAPIDVIWTEEQIEGEKRNQVFISPNKSIPTNINLDLYDVMKNFAGSEDPQLQVPLASNVMGNAIPTIKFKVPVDIDFVRKNGTVNAGDSVVKEMLFELPENKFSIDQERGGQGSLIKSESILLNIIAANKWKRPIYFTSPYGELGFGAYLRREGLAYRLVPVISKYVQADWLIDQLSRRIGLPTSIRDINADSAKNIAMNLVSGGASRPGTYFDEENRRHLLTIRESYAIAAGNLADLGKKEDANAILNQMDKAFLKGNFPYGMVSRYNMHNQNGLLCMEAAYKAGNTQLAEKIGAEVRKDLKQQDEYYRFMLENRAAKYEALKVENQINDGMLMAIDAIEKKYKGGPQPNPELAPQLTPPGVVPPTLKKDSPKSK
jgi:Protein of unknown function (DUF2723)